MCSEYVRLAINWVPHPGSALARFGAAWTGWCADHGEIERSPAIRGLLRERKGVPGAVAQQGLHANVKSPFTLSGMHKIWALHEAIESVARATAPITLPQMEVTVFDGHVVLALSRPDPAVTRLLGAVAAVVDPCLETPLYAKAPTLCWPQPAGRDWGSCDMPVIERFHMPLTDHLELGLAYEVVADLRPILDPILSAGVVLADLALVGDPGSGRPWQLLERYELGAAAEQPVHSMACKGPRLMAAPLETVAGKGQDSLCA